MRKPTQDHLTQGKDSLVAIAGAIHPLLGGVIGVAAALFGPALIRRAGRVEDILQEIKKRPDVFTSELLANEQFQDGLVFFIEQYIRERNEDKLVIMRQVFGGFVQSDNLNEFPLEEMTDLVSRLRFGDIKLFKIAVVQGNQRENDRSFSLNYHPFDVSRLIYFGLLMEDRDRNSLAVRDSTNPGFLHVWVSPLGKQFANYLEDIPSK